MFHLSYRFVISPNVPLVFPKVGIPTHLRYRFMDFLAGSQLWYQRLASQPIPTSRPFRFPTCNFSKAWLALWNSVAMSWPKWKTGFPEPLGFSIANRRLSGLLRNHIKNYHIPPQKNFSECERSIFWGQLRNLHSLKGLDFCFWTFLVREHVDKMEYLCRLDQRHVRYCGNDESTKADGSWCPQIHWGNATWIPGSGGIGTQVAVLDHVWLSEYPVGQRDTPNLSELEEYKYKRLCRLYRP